MKPYCVVHARLATSERDPQGPKFVNLTKTPMHSRNHSIEKLRRELAANPPAPEPAAEGARISTHPESVELICNMG